MLNSNERMGFIIEYMSLYDEKIKMANKNGLFDAAKMFELFAIEVCNVWFGQKFSNLNDETATYPYVDLISENRELLVQVSTVQDIPTKIKTTLEKIRDSKDKKCSDLKNIVFFVLSNNSIDKVREYSGDNQIGSISFTIKDNLITNYLKVSKKDKEFIFNPNMQPKLSGIDRYIKDDDGNCYTSREEEIIDRYLLQEESLEIDVFDMSNYDISTICYVANCGLNFTNESFRMVIHEILLCVIDIWKYTKRNYNAHEIFDVYQEHEIIELFQREMIQTQDDAKMAIDILFDEIDFTKFTTDTIEFYQDIFGNFLCEFFDSYVDSKRRNICKKKILYIEKKVNDIDEEYVRIQLYKSLMLSVTRYCTGDWSKIKTNYSYVDKQFLNKQFTKYGKYHIKELLRTIYQMHMDELLPEILISIRNSFQNAKSEVNKFKKSIREQEAIVQLIILKSFITYSDKIKQDQELIEAYEDILEILINLNYEQAAVILDEFRIH